MEREIDNEATGNEVWVHWYMRVHFKCVLNGWCYSMYGMAQGIRVIYTCAYHCHHLPALGELTFLPPQEGTLTSERGKACLWMCICWSRVNHKFSCSCHKLSCIHLTPYLIATTTWMCVRWRACSLFSLEPHAFTSLHHQHPHIQAYAHFSSNERGLSPLLNVFKEPKVHSRGLGNCSTGLHPW